MQDNQSHIYLIIYALLWACTFWVYQKRRRYFGATSAIILSYLVFAISSIVFYATPDAKSTFGELTLFPLIYLFGMVMLYLIPSIHYKEESLLLQAPNPLTLNIYSLVFIIATFFRLPDIFSNLQQGIMILMLDPSGGEQLYYATHDVVHDNIGGSISNLSAIIYNIFSDIGILLFFYYLSLPNRSKTITIGYFVAIICSLLHPLSQGLRTDVMMKIYNFIIAYFLVKPSLPENIIKYVRTGIISVLGFVLFLFMLLTISRFGDREVGAVGSMVSYTGMSNIYFDKYVLDAGGVRNGDRTCNTFKSLLGFQNIPRNIMETRYRYANLKVDDEHFYTFVGDFVLDFGPVLAVLIFIIASIVMTNVTKTRNNRVEFHQFIMIYFSMIICMQGGMYMFYYSYGGNLTILAFILSYFVFKYTKLHSKL